MADQRNSRWQISRTQNECHQYMLVNQVACDIIIKFPPIGTKAEAGFQTLYNQLKAHKYMLICRSPVFEAMLVGNFSEDGEVTITDIDSDIFMELLK